MKVSKDAMPPEKFRKLVERISKQINFKGCETEEEIADKIKERIKLLEDTYENTPSLFKKERKRLKGRIGNWKGLLKLKFIPPGTWGWGPDGAWLNGFEELAVW